MEYQIEAIDTKLTKILSHEYTIIDIVDGALIYQNKRQVEEITPNEDELLEPKTEIKNYHRYFVAKKSDISAIDCYYSNAAECWLLDINCNGVAPSDDVQLSFDNMEKAKKIATRLVQWWLGIDVNLK